MSEDNTHSKKAQLKRTDMKGKAFTRSVSLAECENGHRFDPKLVQKCWCGAKTRKG